LLAAVIIARMDTQPDRLILASASPRRFELLQRLGLSFTVSVSGVDESVAEGTAPAEMVKGLAVLKARAVAAGLADAVVIGAETTVVIDGAVLNKPVDADDARRMLALLRGRTHEVWTGVAVIHAASERIESSAVRSLVHLKGVSDAVIDAYVATGEPLDKAGAYAIQGGAGLFVDWIEGCYANVVGLPLCELNGLLTTFDIRYAPETPLCADVNGNACPRLSTATAR
jgi:septum formation protein